MLLRIFIAAVFAAAVGIPSSTASSSSPRFAGSWASDCSTSSFYSLVNDSLLVDSPDQATVLAVRKKFRDLVTAPHNIVPYTSAAVDAWDALKFLDRSDRA